MTSSTKCHYGKIIYKWGTCPYAAEYTPKALKWLKDHGLKFMGIPR